MSLLQSEKKAVQPTWGKSGRWVLRHLLFSENFILYLSMLYFLVLCIFIPRMASMQNISNISSNMWPLLAVVIGQMFVLILGGIDLSQASIMAVTSVVGGILMTSELDPVLFEKNPLWGIVLSAEGGPLGGSVLAVPLGVLAMLVVGSLIGLLNGTAVAKFKMPPFMVTLVSMIFFSGVPVQPSMLGVEPTILPVVQSTMPAVAIPTPVNTDSC